MPISFHPMPWMDGWIRAWHAGYIALSRRSCLSARYTRVPHAASAPMTHVCHFSGWRICVCHRGACCMGMLHPSWQWSMPVAARAAQVRTLHRHQHCQRINIFCNFGFPCSSTGRQTPLDVAAAADPDCLVCLCFTDIPFSRTLIGLAWLCCGLPQVCMPYHYW